MREATPPNITPFKQRLGAVWLTYRTRPMMQGVAVIAGLATAFLSVIVVVDEPPSQLMMRMVLLTLPGMAFLASCVALGLHAKSQFVTPNARLLPGYRPAHLRWLRWGSAAGFVACPLVCAHTLNLAPIGVTALALLLATGVVWTLHNPLTSLPLTTLFLTLYHPLVAAFWLDPQLRSWPLHLPLLAFGGWALLRWLRRLDELSEEDSDYSIPPITAAFARPTRSERAEQRKLVAKQIGAGGSWYDGPLDRALNRGGLSCYALMRLTLIPGPAWLRGLIMAVMFCGMAATLTVWFGSGQNPAPFFQFPLMMLIFMPTIFSTQAIDMKRPLLETEVLRPILRDVYYSALFRAMLAETVVVGAVFAAVTAASIAWFAADLLTPERVVGYSVYTVGCNLFFLAASLWMAARHSGLVRTMVHTALTMVIVGCGSYAMYSKGEATGSLLPVACLAGGSLLLVSLPVFRSAYRRWRQMEVA